MGLTFFATEVNNSRHYGFCPLFGKATTSKTRTIGANLGRLWDMLSTTIVATISIAEGAGAGNWQVSPGLTFITTVDRRSHPAFRLVSDLVDLSRFPSEISNIIKIDDLPQFFVRGVEKMGRLLREDQLSLDVRVIWGRKSIADIREFTFVVSTSTCFAYLYASYLGIIHLGWLRIRYEDLLIALCSSLEACGRNCGLY